MITNIENLLLSSFSLKAQSFLPCTRQEKHTVGGLLLLLAHALLEPPTFSLMSLDFSPNVLLFFLSWYALLFPQIFFPFIQMGVVQSPFLSTDFPDLPREAPLPVFPFCHTALASLFCIHFLRDLPSVKFFAIKECDGLIAVYEAPVWAHRTAQVVQ